MSAPLCIYHSSCLDGFGAAWVVRRYFRRSAGAPPEFLAAAYDEPAPDVTGRCVVIVDFSYKLAVLQEMASQAQSILVLDHHKSAAEDLAPFRMADHHLPCAGLKPWLPERGAHALFDMGRSGAGLAWDYFFPADPRPKLIQHVEDGDLWRFAIAGSREIGDCLASHPYDFKVWDDLAQRAEVDSAWKELWTEGAAIRRKRMKDIAELLGVVTRSMVIGGISVPVANMPLTLKSDAANELALGAPFGATYYDKPGGRVFSLRSVRDGVDVSAVASRYGGGGHRNAASFTMPIGWEGDAA